MAADPELVERAREQAAREAGARPLVGLVPGARHSTKVWPVEHLRSLAERCLQEGLAVALLGGRDDAGRDLVRQAVERAVSGFEGGRS